MLDAGYYLSEEDSIELIEDQKNLMCSVFEQSFLDDKGKSVARKHSNYYDAQEAHKGLLNYHTNSVKDSLTTSSQLNYLSYHQNR